MSDRHEYKNLMTLPIGAYVELPQGVFRVEQIERLNQGGWRWNEYGLVSITADGLNILTGEEERYWLSVERDDGWVIGLYQKVDHHNVAGFRNTIRHNDVVYSQTEKGKVNSSLEDADGITPQFEVVYADYEGNDGTQMSLEMYTEGGVESPPEMYVGHLLQRGDVNAWGEVPARGEGDGVAFHWASPIILFLVAIICGGLVLLQLFT